MEQRKSRNYYQRFKEQVDAAVKEGKKPSLLLHACCAPCSSHVLSVVAEYFDVTVFFYNPNIDDKEEYDKRLAELERFVAEAGFAAGTRVVDGGYGPEEFFRMAQGRGDLPEGGERCYDCYKLRLEKTAGYAKDHGFDYFSTTLSISPYKRSDWINELGVELAKAMEGVEGAPAFLFSDFKKENGYKHSIELSKEYCLYRQDYCGCIFSKQERERKLKEKENKDSTEISKEFG
ncbi:MAG: epoxyqueuosine reductase QueH [Eubacterium sp.]|nr:epoxyqueuosine reductase QueH [Eubacterium sp.]